MYLGRDENKKFMTKELELCQGPKDELEFVLIAHDAPRVRVEGGGCAEISLRFQADLPDPILINDEEEETEEESSDEEEDIFPCEEDFI